MLDCRNDGAGSLIISRGRGKRICRVFRAVQLVRDSSIKAVTSLDQNYNIPDPIVEKNKEN